MDLESLLKQTNEQLAEQNEQLAELKGERAGSRFVAPGADPETVRKIAAGESVESGDYRRSWRSTPEPSPT